MYEIAFSCEGDMGSSNRKDSSDKNAAKKLDFDSALKLAKEMAESKYNSLLANNLNKDLVNSEYKMLSGLQTLLTETIPQNYAKKTRIPFFRSKGKKDDSAGHIGQIKHMAIEILMEYSKDKKINNIAVDLVKKLYGIINDKIGFVDKGDKGDAKEDAKEDEKDEENRVNLDDETRLEDVLHDAIIAITYMQPRNGARESAIQQYEDGRDKRLMKVTKL